MLADTALALAHIRYVGILLATPDASIVTASLSGRLQLLAWFRTTGKLFQVCKCADEEV
jgi:hypothetical protein